MHFEGTFTVQEQREKVWSFLMDPVSLGNCLPDLKKLEVISEDRFNAKIRAGISFIKGDFFFRFSVEEKRAPSYAKLKARGTGAQSSIDLDADMNLTETSDNATMILWKAEAHVRGLLASVGQRLLQSAADKIVNQLFKSIESHITQNGS